MRGGADRCAATILIDGMAVRQDPAFPLNDLVMPDMLEGIEIYTDAATIPPALGGVGNNCGVVAFWTRTPDRGNLTWKKVAFAGAIFVLGIILLVR